MPLHRHQVEVAPIGALANKLCDVLEGKPNVVGEVALVMAYLSVCEGTKRYPKASERERMIIALERGTAALASIVVEVEKLSEADVALIARPARTV